MTKELYIVSRDVLIDFNPAIPGETYLGKHTGYMLVEKDEQGNILSVETVDLKSGNFSNIEFVYGSSENSFILSDGTIVPGQVYVGEEWVDVTPQWCEENHYKSKVIGDISNPEETFNKIKQNALLIDTLRELGFPFNYGILNQNCNTWSQYIAKNYLNNFDIIDYLNEGIATPDVYQGSESNFPYVNFGPDAMSAALLHQISEILESEKIKLEDTGLQISSDLFAVTVSINIGTMCIERQVSYYSFAPGAVINKIQSVVTSGEGTASPLVIDIDGDGVETKEENSQIYFDHDGNGFAESSGWVGQDDGLLVRDINGNGQIDDGTELFGNNSVLSNGQSAANDNDILFSSKAL